MIKKDFFDDIIRDFIEDAIVMDIEDQDNDDRITLGIEDLKELLLESLVSASKKFKIFMN